MLIAMRSYGSIFKDRRTYMLFTEFKEHYNFAPLELYEFAEEADDITDAPELKGAAEQFLFAKRTFERLLQEYEIELG